MANSIDSITPILLKYLDIVKQKNIEISKVYVFGSYAHGTATPDSDIDIAIISKHFKGDRFQDRRLLVPLRRSIDNRIEPIPYRPEDFNDFDPLAVEIIENGIEIVCN